MGRPISNVPWSPDVVAQNLEILAVALSQGKLTWLKPVHAASLRVGLSRSAKPSDVVLEVIGWYPLVARVVHSTSWRYEEGLVVLTYVAVVDPRTATVKAVTAVEVYTLNRQDFQQLLRLSGEFEAAITGRSDARFNERQAKLMTRL